MTPHKENSRRPGYCSPVITKLNRKPETIFTCLQTSIMPNIIYSFVAQKNHVLVDYTTFSGNFSTVAIQCLQKCSETNSRFTYTCDHHNFNFVVEDGYSKITSAIFMLCMFGLSSVL